MKRKRVPQTNLGRALPCGNGGQEEALLRRCTLILRRVRLAKGISVAELGRATGLSRQGINLIESGRGNPEDKSLLRICHALNVAPHGVWRLAQKQLGWVLDSDQGQWQL